MRIQFQQIIPRLKNVKAKNRVYILPMISLHIIIPKFQPNKHIKYQKFSCKMILKNRMRLQKKVCPHCAQCHSSSSQLRCCLVCLSSHTIDNDTAADRSLNGEQKGHKEGPDNEPRRAAVGAMFFFGSLAHCQFLAIQTFFANQSYLNILFD